MRNEVTKLKTFERRTLVIGGVKLTVFSILVGRLYQLQIIESDEYKTLSEGNRVKLIPVMPSRGRLIDRNGINIAENQNYFRAVFEPYGKEFPEEIIKNTMNMLVLTPEEQAEVLKKFSENRRNEIIIKEYLDWEQVSKIELNKPDLPGVSIEMGQVRSYPYWNDSSHLVGYIGPVSKDEAKDNVILRHPDFRVGKNGIEKICEEILRGKPGIRRVEVDVHGTSARELSIEESTSGRDLNLTIDIELQKFASERLTDLGGVKKEGASCVVIDVENGDILTLVSKPAFDTNNFIRGISKDLWKELTENPDVPLVNKSISNQYPPGSTFKMAVGLAALEAGAINGNSTVYCPGYFYLGSKRFNCWKKEGHGSLNIKEAISHSCNVFFYTMAQRIGVEKIAEMCNKFGMGIKTGIELPNEKPGIIPTKKWKKETYGRDWLLGETINTGIGQGYVLTTPLQLAVYAARIASRGKKISPRIIKGSPELQKEIHSLSLKNSTIMEKILSYREDTSAEDISGVSKAHIDMIMEGMEMVVNAPNGTAYQSRITLPGFEMAGKTGTAQVRGNPEGIDTSKVEKRFRNHALFVGYAPIANPKFAISVVVEHGNKGSATAAPAGRDILLEAQRLFAMRQSTPTPEDGDS